MIYGKWLKTIPCNKIFKDLIAHKKNMKGIKSLSMEILPNLNVGDTHYAITNILKASKASTTTTSQL